MEIDVRNGINNDTTISKEDQDQEQEVYYSRKMTIVNDVNGSPYNSDIVATNTEADITTEKEEQYKEAAKGLQQLKSLGQVFGNENGQGEGLTVEDLRRYGITCNVDEDHDPMENEGEDSAANNKAIKGTPTGARGMTTESTPVRADGTADTAETAEIRHLRQLTTDFKNQNIILSTLLTESFQRIDNFLKTSDFLENQLLKNESNLLKTQKDLILLNDEKKKLISENNKLHANLLTNSTSDFKNFTTDFIQSCDMRLQMSSYSRRLRSSSINKHQDDSSDEGDDDDLHNSSPASRQLVDPKAMKKLQDNYRSLQIQFSSIRSELDGSRQQIKNLELERNAMLEQISELTNEKMSLIKQLQQENLTPHLSKTYLIRSRPTLRLTDVIDEEEDGDDTDEEEEDNYPTTAAPVNRPSSAAGNKIFRLSSYARTQNQTPNVNSSLDKINKIRNSNANNSDSDDDNNITRKTPTPVMQRPHIKSASTLSLSKREPESRKQLSVLTPMARFRKSQESFNTTEDDDESSENEDDLEDEFAGKFITGDKTRVPKELQPYGFSKQTTSRTKSPNNGALRNKSPGIARVNSPNNNPLRTKSPGIARVNSPNKVIARVNSPPTNRVKSPPLNNNSSMNLSNNNNNNNNNNNRNRRPSIYGTKNASTPVLNGRRSSTDLSPTTNSNSNLLLNSNSNSNNIVVNRGKIINTKTPISRPQSRNGTPITPNSARPSSRPPSRPRVPSRTGSAPRAGIRSTTPTNSHYPLTTTNNNNSIKTHAKSSSIVYANDVNNLSLTRIKKNTDSDSESESDDDNRTNGNVSSGEGVKLENEILKLKHETITLKKQNKKLTDYIQTLINQVQVLSKDGKPGIISNLIVNNVSKVSNKAITFHDFGKDTNNDKQNAYHNESDEDSDSDDEKLKSNNNGNNLLTMVEMGNSSVKQGMGSLWSSKLKQQQQQQQLHPNNNKSKDNNNNKDKENNGILSNPAGSISQIFGLLGSTPQPTTNNNNSNNKNNADNDEKPSSGFGRWATGNWGLGRSSTAPTTAKEKVSENKGGRYSSMLIGDDSFDFES